MYVSRPARGAGQARVLQGQRDEPQARQGRGQEEERWQAGLDSHPQAQARMVPNRSAGNLACPPSLGLKAAGVNPTAAISHSGGGRP